MSSKRGGLRTIAKALNDGDLARAQIAAVLLGIPDPPPLSKRNGSRDQMIKLIRDLHWSGLLKWDPDEHPRWPAGSADGKGGEFAPKGEGGEADGSQSTQSDATHSYNSQQYAPRARIQLADAGMSDASDDPVAEAVRAAAVEAFPVASDYRDRSNVMNERELTALFRKLGARDPEGWARSQINENIPQLARFLFLKQAWKLVVRDNDSSWISEMHQFDSNKPGGDAGPAIARLLAAGGRKDDLTKIVRVMQWRLLSGLWQLLDDPGNIDSEAGDIAWRLFQVDESDHPIALMGATGGIGLGDRPRRARYAAKMNSRMGRRPRVGRRTFSMNLTRSLCGRL